MVMTTDEIVMEYKQAKAPMKQISILADENLCSRDEIIAILREAGAELPKVYQKKDRMELKPAEDLAIPTMFRIQDIKAVAFEVICNMVEENNASGVTGVVELVRALETN